MGVLEFEKIYVLSDGHQQLPRVDCDDHRAGDGELGSAVSDVRAARRSDFRGRGAHRPAVRLVGAARRADRVVCGGSLFISRSSLT